MRRPVKVEKELREAAYAAAISAGRELVDHARGYIGPAVKIGSLSDGEWDRLVHAIISGWIVARSRQLLSERVADEDEFLATGEVPEPFELGICAHALPALGELVEKLDLAAKAIGQWTKDEVLLFVWTAADLVAQAKALEGERPGPVELPEITLMMAG